MTNAFLLPTFVFWVKCVEKCFLHRSSYFCMYLLTVHWNTEFDIWNYWYVKGKCFLFQELNDLRKPLLTGHTASGKSDDAPCTLEEIERTQKDLLERGFQVVKTERKSQKAFYLTVLSIFICLFWPPLFTPTVLKVKMMSMSSQSRCFSRQVEDLCQHLLKETSIFSPNEAQDVILSLTQTLLSAENHLKNAQESDLKVML